MTTIRVDGIDRPVHDSRGRLIHPTEQGIRNFWRWFGDSRVIDSEGRPLMLAHVSTPDAGQEGIAVFDTKRGELGTHFGTPDQANHMAWSDEARHFSAAVYLAIRHPLRLVDHGTWSPDAVAGQLYAHGLISRAVRNELSMLGCRDRAAVRRMHQVIEQAGFDGIVYLNRGEGVDTEAAGGFEEGWSDDRFRTVFPMAADSFIAFHPNQIKSALANAGSFNAWRPEIDDRPEVSPRQVRALEAGCAP